MTIAGGGTQEPTAQLTGMTAEAMLDALPDAVFVTDGALGTILAANGLPHVLIAEDDAVTRGVACALLANNGFRVSEAVDGVDTLGQLEKSRDIALLVLDLAMPRMTGQEVLRRLRGSMATSSLPVVVLTGATEDQTEIDLMEAGADDYVRKPLDPARFVARVKAALRRAAH